jgi:outer membrane protein assembly factor BamB
VVTSDGSRDAMVWLIDAYASDQEFNAPGLGFEHTRPVLYAIDAMTLKPLWHTGVDELGEGGKYTIPVIRHGQVVVATDRVRAYGLP